MDGERSNKRTRIVSCNSKAICNRDGRARANRNGGPEGHRAEGGKESERDVSEGYTAGGRGGRQGIDFLALLQLFDTRCNLFAAIPLCEQIDEPNEGKDEDERSDLSLMVRR